MPIKPRYSLTLTSGTLLLALVVLASAAAAQTPTPRPAADSTKAQRPQRPAPSPASDSIVQRLRALKGYTVVEYEGESATYRADEGVLRLQGNAEITREGQKLTADTIVYLRDKKLVEAFGHPTVSGQEANAIEGNVLVYDFERKRAVVRGGLTKYEQAGATWLVQGDVTAETGGENARFYTTSGCFTTDDRFNACMLLGDSMPQYHFESDRIMMIRNKLIVARPARLYFRNVPVAWLPFVVQNLERGRRSGLLVPQFGINDIVQTSSRQSREISNVGFYWAINDYLGGQLSGRWRSGTYTSLTGALDYRVRSQFFEGHFDAEQFWPQEGVRQLTFSSANSWRPDERTTLGLSARYATSPAFVRRTSTEYGEAIQDLTSNLRADRRFDWGTVAVGADRRQSMSDGSVDMTLPSLSISPNSITLFPSLDASSARWYNNANLKWGFSGTRQSFARPLDLQIAQKRGNEDRLNLGGSQNFQMGNFTWNTDARLNRTLMQAIEAIDSVPATDRRNDDNAQWNTSLAYRLPLVGSSSISPNLSLNQALVRNERSARVAEANRYVAGPVRANFGAGTSIDLYGFFPGIGAYSAIRHRLSLAPSYRYSPKVVQTAAQDSVFGVMNSMQQNVVSLSFNQTFEAKLKASKPKDSDRVAQDSLAADSIGGNPVPPAGPEEVRKVTILRIDTTPLEFDFERAKQGKTGFRTHTLTNTIGSDYLRGMNINFTHELFKPAVQAEGEPYDPFALGGFSPHLSQVNAQFEIGPGSGLLRWLGLGQGAARDIGQADRGQVPGVAPDSDPMLGGPSTATGVRRPSGDGRVWNLSVQYALVRPRQTLAGRSSGESQNVVGALAFPLTPNWALNWRTNYSITDGRFGAHWLSLVRDLYRWQANFDFVRTETGNTSFMFRVQLKDLPDLKVDYRESNLGGLGR